MDIKRTLILVAIFIVLIAGAVLIKANLTGYLIKDYSTYTKAICDKDNLCQDYKITCENKEVVSVSPITGATIQHAEDWEDFRENKSEILCE